MRLAGLYLIRAGRARVDSRLPYGIYLSIAAIATQLWRALVRQVFI